MLTEELFFEDNNPKKIANIFAVEEKALATERFSVRIDVKNNGIKFSMKAKDAVAFKTVKTSVNKLLALYKKIKALKFFDE